MNHILRIRKNDPKITASKLATRLKEVTNKDVSAQMVMNTLKFMDIFGFRMAKSLCLDRPMSKDGMNYAKSGLTFQMITGSGLFFSGEAPFNLIGSDGNGFCWRELGTRLEPKYVKMTLKNVGGKLMMWGIMAWGRYVLLWKYGQVRLY